MDEEKGSMEKENYENMKRKNKKPKIIILIVIVLAILITIFFGWLFFESKFLDEGETAFKNNNYDMAESYFSKAIKFNPFNRTTRTKLENVKTQKLLDDANKMSSSNRFDDAIKILQDALIIDPQNTALLAASEKANEGKVAFEQASKEKAALDEIGRQMLGIQDAFKQIKNNFNLGTVYANRISDQMLRIKSIYDAAHQMKYPSSISTIGDQWVQAVEKYAQAASALTRSYNDMTHFMDSTIDQQTFEEKLTEAYRLQKLVLKEWGEKIGAPVNYYW